MLIFFTKWLLFKRILYILPLSCLFSMFYFYFINFGEFFNFFTDFV